MILWTSPTPTGPGGAYSEAKCVDVPEESFPVPKWGVVGAEYTGRPGAGVKLNEEDRYDPGIGRGPHVGPKRR